MIKKSTYLSIIKHRLSKNGKISRNEMLEIYIARLAPRIIELKKAGWNIEGKREKTEWGTDYVYHLIPHEEKPLS